MVFYVQSTGKRTEIGLGSFTDVPLSVAREKAAEQRQILKAGLNPLHEKRKLRNEQKLKAAKAMSFADCARAYVEANRSGWSNSKHAQQWSNTLEQYAFPIFGDSPVAEVDTALVSKCLQQIWNSKNETASRLRGRIESVLDWATVHQFREGENPARWRGHLDKLFPKPSKVQKVEHHAALPYVEISSFIMSLHQQVGFAAKCLEFTILTAARTGESIGATWDEIDLAAKVWNVPAIRMKAKKPHRVPLSLQALALLSEMESLRINDYVFSGTKKGLSNMAMLQLLKRMNRNNITPHGFRSTFRDWAAETTSYPNEVVEMALAHVIQNQAEAAYRRGDLFDKRANLMQDWADFAYQNQSKDVDAELRKGSLAERLNGLDNSFFRRGPR
ncbi:tyrosine-type recombinase/integrase [Methylomonas koyamae]|uniref:tyrosine-type recombinase/integrase n=1 Tax=Methylomonas koyamae TaxID=702114 RepID=UPI0007C95416|nr:tyrosine-type recombinase/integrase [Methylomonas koyamae]